MHAGDVFTLCISRVRDGTLRARLRAVRQEIENAAVTYDDRAQLALLHLIPSANGVGNITAEEMVKVYTGRMVGKDAPGRAVYDRLISGAPHERCPLCGVGTVSSLDHFLPKASFPVFAVTPNNLVPSCSWCQENKREYFPQANSKQLIHPYFDDFEEVQWLHARVIETTPAAFEFFASLPEGWNVATRERLEAHLTQLRLYRLFASNSASRLCEIRARLGVLLQRGGAEAVRSHLKEESESLEVDHKNSWQSAMFRAAHQSDWFCDGGFAHL